MAVRQSADRGTPRLDLGVALQEYTAPSEGYVGTMLLPVFGVPKRNGDFSKIKIGAWLRDRDVRRAPGQPFARDGFEAGSISFDCKVFGLEGKLPDEEVEYYSSEFDAEMVTAELVMQAILREQEKRVAAKLDDVTSTGFYSSDSTLYTDVNAWSNSNADPVADVEAAIEQLALRGVQPNVLKLSASWKKYIVQNSSILDRLKYTNRASTPAILAALPELMGVERVVWCNALKNTAAEGETDSLSRIWSSSYAHLLQVARTQSLAEPCIGRTFRWDALSAENALVNTYYEQQTKSTVVQVSQYTDENMFDPRYGHCLKID